ncbi:ATPase AAA [Burkholderia pseudomallei]|nr:ATPase AAA [Burkholderia pseudomallei]
MIRIEKDAAAPALEAFHVASVGPKNNKVTRAADELTRAIRFFTDPLNYANEQKLCKSSFAFKVYKDKELTAVLGRIFGKKCAYCESRVAHVMPKEIEHFRPKSAVENAGQPALRPGYYWLAADWSNLLVACVDCNRARRHAVPGQTAEVRLGKHTQFPLSNEQRRVRQHTGNVADEEQYRLLIHPCLDQPEDLLTYDDDGLIHPKDANDLRAKTSITVYALQRKALVEERKRVLNELKFDLELLRSLAMEFNEMHVRTPQADRDRKRDQLLLQMRSIRQMFEPEAPFLGMVRDYVRRHAMAGAYADMLRAGIDLRHLLP